MADALTHSNKTAEDTAQPAFHPEPRVNPLRDKLIVFIAQGFGVGRIPFAPGTWGSVLGVAWFYALSFAGPVVFAATTLLSIPLAALVCGEAARNLRQKDPSSVVLDEIIAVPISGWLMWMWIDRPPAALAASPWFDEIQRQPWIALILIFLLFRLFDIWKPWPIRQSQHLPGGWGIVMDDVLAAVYVNLVLFAAFRALAQ